MLTISLQKLEMQKGKRKNVKQKLQPTPFVKHITHFTEN